MQYRPEKIGLRLDSEGWVEIDELLAAANRFGSKLIMEHLVRLKFTTHADLRAKLLATGDAELMEGNTWNDRFWGVCRGHGRNELGQILMRVGAELEYLTPRPAAPPTASG